MNRNKSIDGEVIDQQNGDVEVFEWTHLKNCYERMRNWLSIGPGSRKFRSKRHTKCTWQDGGGWRGLSLETSDSIRMADDAQQPSSAPADTSCISFNDLTTQP